ncbi:hypothetical protein BOW53_06010 [Solemya pervernicosa gill symbiont]|uniref:Uncharacterized protein n=2 Tax=Gammaproteobacteria incertae sedis TaxID=118884 RepID=A0A1T2L705_9GAMM|nr:hypothetical protein [Candidatus Reidiella endopervernicosa]OOZ40887.1 hypothetical protein BOW53_06010 [Solemya pervernicosa gill symbiont]QKQ26144.1 hypothetical protein HUE57_07485 [Candidatus Reidiella endopervernicosa]
MIRALFLLLIATLSTPLLAGDNVVVIDPEVWAVPRHGETILKLDGLQEQMLQLDEGQLITVHYPDHEEGLLWAEELKGWLISFGLPSSRITLNTIDVNEESLKIFFEKSTGN